MKKLWHKWKSRKHPSRGVRITRNLLVTCALVVLLWAELDYPLPQEMQFRRMERANLMPESEIVYQDEEGNVVGIRDGIVVCAYLRGANPGDWELRRYEVGDEPAVVPLLRPYYKIDGEDCPRVVAINIPTEAELAELMLFLSRDMQQGSVISISPYRTEGEQSLVFSFPLYPSGEGVGQWFLSQFLHDGCSQFPYELEFYVNNEVLSQTKGVLPLATTSEVEPWKKSELN